MPRFSYLFSFDGLTFSFGHLFGKSLFAMFLDVTDAGGTVGIEQKGEHIAYPIGKHLTFLYIMWTFGAGIELISLTTRTDFTFHCVCIRGISQSRTCGKLRNKGRKRRYFEYRVR